MGVRSSPCLIGSTQFEATEELTGKIETERERRKAGVKPAGQTGPGSLGAHSPAHLPKVEDKKNKKTDDSITTRRESSGKARDV